MSAESVAVSVKTAAQMTELSETTLREAINKQQLPAYRVGRVIRVRVADLEDWVGSLTRVGSEDDQ
jgi:excisionase family DNA binding protein